MRAGGPVRHYLYLLQIFSILTTRGGANQTQMFSKTASLIAEDSPFWDLQWVEDGVTQTRQVLLSYSSNCTKTFNEFDELTILVHASPEWVGLC